MVSPQAWANGDILDAGSLNNAISHSTSAGHIALVLPLVDLGSNTIYSQYGDRSLKYVGSGGNKATRFTFFDCAENYVVTNGSNDGIYGRTQQAFLPTIGSIRTFNNMAYIAQNDGNTVNTSGMWLATGSIIDTFAGTLSTTAWTSGIPTGGSIVQTGDTVTLIGGGANGSTWIQSVNHSNYWFVAGSVNTNAGSAMRVGYSSGTYSNSTTLCTGAGIVYAHVWLSNGSMLNVESYKNNNYSTQSIDVGGSLGNGFKFQVFPLSAGSISLYLAKYGSNGSSQLTTKNLGTLVQPPNYVQGDIVGTYGNFTGSATIDVSTDSGATWTSNIPIGQMGQITSTLGSVPIVRFNVIQGGADTGATHAREGIKGWGVTFFV